MDALKVKNIILKKEVMPGIPLGELVGGEWDRIPIITKAGGFGADDTIVKSLKYLRDEVDKL